MPPWSLTPLQTFQVSFKISVKSEKCPLHGNSESIKIRPLGFNEEVEVVLNFICDCQCAKDGIANSPECHSGHGTFECGACKYVLRPLQTTAAPL